MADEIIEIDEAEEIPVLPKRRMQVDTEMDMTPMIDCTFLLLVFFVVGAKLDPDAIVQLPPARYGAGVDPAFVSRVPRFGYSSLGDESESGWNRRKKRSSTNWVSLMSSVTSDSTPSPLGEIDKDRVVLSPSLRVPRTRTSIGPS